MPSSDQYLFGRRGLLPRLVIFHVCVFVILVSWLFGGNALGLRPHLLLWGSLALPLSLWALIEHRRCEASSWGQTRWLVPFLLFNLVVILGCLNPNFREISLGTGTGFVKGGDIAWLPSAARPDLSLRALWLFDCLFLSAFNLLLAVRRRRHLRTLVIICILNGITLAVFGTFQKLTGAPGLFFGKVPSTNPTFFASFIYHNHWGAFTLLNLAACLGMIWHAARNRHGEHRDFIHSPALLWLTGAFILASTIPLSSSRSCTLLLAFLCLCAFIHAGRLMLRISHQSKASRARLFVSTLAISTLVLLAIFWLARPVLEQRWKLTKQQVSQMQEQGGIGARMTLYRDTFRMAADRPVFGWGMASYPTVFFLYNTQKPNVDKLPVTYVDAHNDWLQSLSEHGIVGSAILLLLGFLPLRSLRHVERVGTLPRYLLAGCLLILLYAWVEFPFGNPAVILLWWTLFFTAILYPRTD